MGRAPPGTMPLTNGTWRRSRSQKKGKKERQKAHTKLEVGFFLRVVSLRGLEFGDDLPYGCERMHGGVSTAMRLRTPTYLSGSPRPVFQTTLVGSGTLLVVEKSRYDKC
ncbi:unnamed protein product [Ectocarpus sp. 13 AM-2016]